MWVLEFMMAEICSSRWLPVCVPRRNHCPPRKEKPFGELSPPPRRYHQMDIHPQASPLPSASTGLNYLAQQLWQGLERAAADPPAGPLVGGDSGADWLPSPRRPQFSSTYKPAHGLSVNPVPILVKGELVFCCFQPENPNGYIQASAF